MRPTGRPTFSPTDFLETISLNTGRRAIAEHVQAPVTAALDGTTKIAGKAGIRVVLMASTPGTAAVPSTPSGSEAGFDARPGRWTAMGTETPARADVAGRFEVVDGRNRLEPSQPAAPEARP